MSISVSRVHEVRRSKVGGDFHRRSSNKKISKGNKFVFTFIGAIYYNEIHKILKYI